MAGDTVRAHVSLYDPRRDQGAHYESFEVPFEPGMRVLEVLDYIVGVLGRGVAYRWFCGVKKCGLCGLTVNGRPILACWEPAEREMVIEPLKNFPVIRDLVIDRSGYERTLGTLQPRLIRRREYGGFPEPLSHDEMRDAYHLMDCIECLVCSAACPVLEVGGTTFAGPAPLVQLARYALDARDGGDRAETIARGAAVYQCVSCYRCNAVCPQSIDVLDTAIEQLRGRSLRQGAGGRHFKVFADLVRERGLIDPATLYTRAKGLRAITGIGMAMKLALKGKLSRGDAPPAADRREIEHIFGVCDEEGHQ